MLRLTTAALALLAGCSGDALTAPDVRFETRDAVVDPRDQGPSLDAGDDRAEAPAPVDVTVYDAAFDAPYDAGASPADASRSDVSLLDIPLPLDAPATPCTDLAERYAAAVREAAVCAASTECAARVCETLCCTCEVFVTAAGESVRALDALRTRAERMGCSAMLPCPSTRCPAPRSGLCSTDGRCVTLREPADAGTSP